MLTGSIHYDGITRNIVDAFALDGQGRVLMLLEADGYPTLAVSGRRYKDSGLFVDLQGHHRVEDRDRFAAKLEMLIEMGVYD
jgi:hypothetical protein